MAESAKPQKLVVVATHGEEDPERATIPFVVANAALAMEAHVTVVLQADGVAAATRGLYETVRAGGFDPLEKLVDSLVSSGGTLLVCIPCMEQRHIGPERLVPGAQPAKAGRIALEMIEATNVVSY